MRIYIYPGGIQAVVNAKELALLMIRVATHPELRSQTVSQGTVQAQKFTSAESAERILDLYEQVLGAAS